MSLPACAKIYLNQPMSPSPSLCPGAPTPRRRSRFVRLYEQEGKGGDGCSQSDIRPGWWPLLSRSWTFRRYDDFRRGVTPVCGVWSEAVLRLVAPLSGLSPRRLQGAATHRGDLNASGVNSDVWTSTCNPAAESDSRLSARREAHDEARAAAVQRFLERRRCRRGSPRRRARSRGRARMSRRGRPRRGRSARRPWREVGRDARPVVLDRRARSRRCAARPWPRTAVPGSVC